MPALHVTRTGIWEGKGRPEAMGEQQHPAPASPQPCSVALLLLLPSPTYTKSQRLHSHGQLQGTRRLWVGFCPGGNLCHKLQDTSRASQTVSCSLPPPAVLSFPRRLLEEPMG